MNYFFWFLLLLAVPILVHLFSFRRARRLLFTNVRFIKQVSSETKSKTRLKQILILSSRLLAFLCLILAFIFSFLSFEDQGVNTDNTFGTIYLDNSSGSVGSSINDETVIIEDLIRKSSGQNGRLITNDFEPFSNRERTAGEVIKESRLLDVSYVHRNLSEVLDRSNDKGSVYLISDLEDADIQDLERIRNDSVRTYFLLKNERTSTRNAYVDSLWLERDLESYENMILKCVLGRSEDFSEGNVVVKLLDEGGAQVSSIVKKLQDDPLLNFTVPVQDEDVKYRLQLTGDDVTYDNDFYFVIGKNRIPRILLISESDNTYLRNIFGNDELFKLEISDPQEINYERLADVDLLVLNDFDQFPRGLIAQAIGETSVLIFPSDSIDIENYRSEGFFSIGFTENTESQQIQLEDGNPLLEGAIGALNDDSFLPRAVRKYYISSSHERIFATRDGGTLFGKNVDQPLYFFLTPLRDEFTELATHSIFLPMMYRVAEGSVVRSRDIFSYSGEYVELNDFESDAPPKIVSSDIELIPEFIPQGSVSYIKVPGSLVPGFYDIIQGTDTIRSIGLNIPKNESIFDGLSFDELQEFFAGEDHVKVISIFDELGESSLPVEESNHLWKYALILATMFFLVETLFHRYLK